jgi:ABC-type branched-subunit amino acid transport system ATPase component
MLECKDISKNFGGLKAVSNLSMAVDQGEIVGLVGPNGSGKSTLINLITGIHLPNGGRMSYLGEDITYASPHSIINLGIAHTHQIPRPFGTMTVRENVAIGCMFGRDKFKYGQANEAAQEWLEFTDLAPYAEVRVGNLNLHQRKFLELARALASRPRLLMLDEVLAGLNPAEIDASIEMIRKIHNSGVTIIIVEHIMKAVISLSNRIIVLDQGSIIANGQPQEVMRDAAVVKAYLGKEYDA